MNVKTCKCKGGKCTCKKARQLVIRTDNTFKNHYVPNPRPISRKLKFQESREKMILDKKKRQIREQRVQVVERYKQRQLQKHLDYLRNAPKKKIKSTKNKLKSTKPQKKKLKKDKGKSKQKKDKAKPKQDKVKHNSVKRQDNKKIEVISSSRAILPEDNFCYLTLKTLPGTY